MSERERKRERGRGREGKSRGVRPVSKGGEKGGPGVLRKAGEREGEIDRDRSLGRGDQKEKNTQKD